MTTLSPLNRFIVFVLVGGMFAALAFYAAQRTATFWKAPFVRFARASRSIQALVLAGLIAVTALGGGKTNDPPLRVLGDVDPPRVVANPPAWFVALGYPATDADANGIPDCWEKWTHTTGMADDDDPDGDGLTNYDEFEARTDPIRADTDGDGLDDGTELAGLAAGVADLAPLSPATFSADEPDADGDGIPDLWEGSDAIPFDGCDPDGFPWDVSIPEAASTNYDVRLSVSSSRHAALSWGTDESLLLPPCTNLTLRLRLSADDIKTVALSPSPNASTNPVGTWRAALVADWDARRGFPTEGDRVALADGTMVDRSEQESVSAQAWMPSPALRSGGPNRAGGGRRKPEISFTPRWVCLLVENDSFCSIHGPAPTVRVFAENAEPPYVWTERGVSTTTQTDSFTPSNPYPDGHYEFSVMWPDSHEVLFVQAPIRLDPITCRSGRTNLVGAAWSSTHNPTNAADHAPGIAEETVSFGPNCPVAHDVNLIRGYKHSPPPDIRNLVRIVTGNLQDDDTDHCLGLVWSTNLVINLDDYLDSSSEQCGGNLYFELETDATVSFVSNSITVPREPADLNPVIIHALLRIPNESRPADRLWIVVNSRETKKQFDDWYDHNSTNLSWIATLPRPPATISLDTNGDPLPLESPYNSSWSNPERVNQTSFMHHDAVYEIRTNINAIPGNQATYDREGRLIQTGIAAGTADSYGPYTSHGVPWPNMRHYYRDVEPFIRAVQLDGNPIRAGLRSFNRPCLFQGQHIEKYIFCRPTSHP